jgi:hypothetical protein
MILRLIGKDSETYESQSVVINFTDKEDRILLEWDGKTFEIMPFTDMSLSIKPYGFTESIGCSPIDTDNPITSDCVVIR